MSKKIEKNVNEKTKKFGMRDCVAYAAGDFAGMVSAKEIMDRAHKSQNDLYKSLGINYNTNPGLYDNLSVRPEAQMKDLSSLANMYGITTDEQEILNKYLSLVDAQYTAKRREYAQAENDWYSNMATVSADNVSALRKTYDNAVASGASSGLVAASILGEQLGLTQDTINTATELANKRFNLIDQEAEARTQAALNAFNDSQNIKTTLGQLASQIYASDVQKDVAWWDREAQLDANEATRNAATIQALSTWLTGKNDADVKLELGYLEDDYNRYALLNQNEQNALNRESQERMNAEDNATARYTSDNNLKGTMYSTDGNLEGTKLSVAGNKEIAKINANANTNANSYKGGGSSGTTNNDLYTTPTDAINAAYDEGTKLFKEKKGNYYAAAKAQANIILQAQGFQGDTTAYNKALNTILNTFKARASK